MKIFYFELEITQEIKRVRLIHIIPLLLSIIFFQLIKDVFLSTCFALSKSKVITFIPIIFKVLIHTQFSGWVQFLLIQFIFLFFLTQLIFIFIIQFLIFLFLASLKSFFIIFLLILILLISLNLLFASKILFLDWLIFLPQ